MYESFKAHLESELAALTADLELIATFDPATGDWVATPNRIANEADENLGADRVEDWNEKRALMPQLETRYRNIQIALHKFTTDTYGICEICKEHIETDRLQANPAARTCKIHLEHERVLPF